MKHRSSRLSSGFRRASDGLGGVVGPHDLAPPGQEVELFHVERPRPRPADAPVCRSSPAVRPWGGRDPHASRSLGVDAGEGSLLRRYLAHRDCPCRRVRERIRRTDRRRERSLLCADRRSHEQSGRRTQPAAPPTRARRRQRHRPVRIGHLVDHRQVRSGVCVSRPMLGHRFTWNSQITRPPQGTGPAHRPGPTKTCGDARRHRQTETHPSPLHPLHTAPYVRAPTPSGRRAGPQTGGSSRPMVVSRPRHPARDEPRQRPRSHATR